MPRSMQTSFETFWSSEAIQCIAYVSVCIHSLLKSIQANNLACIYSTLHHTFTLCNGCCWLPSGFSLFHIHTFCILTWSLRWDLIWFKLQLCIHDSAMHILHEPGTKVNSYYITWLFKLLAVNADPSETPISCAKCLNNLWVLISNHTWIP